MLKDFQPPSHPPLQNGSCFVGLFCSYGNANSHEILILQLSLLTKRRKVFVLTWRSEFRLCLCVSQLWPHAYNDRHEIWNQWIWYDNKAAYVKGFYFPPFFEIVAIFWVFFAVTELWARFAVHRTTVLVFIRLYQSKEVNVLYHFPCPKHFSWDLIYL